MIKWTKAAGRDLEQHYEFMVMAGIWNPDDVISRIMDMTEGLVINPKMGRHIKDNLYKLTLKNPQYVIHYYLDDDIFITRVYHHRQNRNL